MEYQGWVNPYAASMGDLIARSGNADAMAAQAIAEARARADMIRAGAWSGAVQGIANLPREIEASHFADTTNKLRQQELDARGQALAENNRQRVVMTLGRLAGSSKSAGDFVSGVDAIAQSGGIPADVAAHIKTQVQQAGPGGWQALQGQYTGFASQYQEAVKLGPGDQLVRPSLIPGQAPTTVASIPNKPVDLGPGHQLVPDAGGAPVASAPFAPGTGQHVVNGQVVDAAGAPVGAAVPKQETPSERDLNVGRLREINAKLEGTVPISPKEKADLEIEKRRVQAQIDHWKREDDANGATLDNLTPEAKDLLAKNFAMTGNVPPMGNGKAGQKTRVQLFNRAAELYGQMDLATQRAAYDANKKSLNQLQPMADAVNAFESTSRKNIDLFLEQARQVPDLGVPLTNTPIRWISGKVLGGTEVPAYEAARRVAVNEIAKVTSNPNLTGALSDSARHEVESFVPENATLGQAVKVMEVLKQDMENRRTSIADQIQAIRERIAAPPAGSSGPAAAAGVSVTNGGKTYGPFPDQAAADRFVADAKAKKLWK